MPAKERLHFLLRHDAALSYSVKEGEWPEIPEEEEDENNPRPPPYTHRFRMRANGRSWKVYLLKLVKDERRARRWFLGKRSSEESVQRYVASKRAQMRSIAGADAVLWVLAARGMGYVAHYPV